MEVTILRRGRRLGVYTTNRKHGGFDVYANERGAYIHYLEGWKLSEDGSIEASDYASDVLSNLPPLGFWHARNGTNL